MNKLVAGMRSLGNRCLLALLAVAAASHGVWAADASTIFAVGADGVVLVTRDAGQSWQKMETPTTADLTAVWGSSSSDVYAVGARGAAIHFDGQIWRTFSLETEQALLDVWGLDADHVYIVGAQVAFAREDGAGILRQQIATECLHAGEGVGVGAVEQTETIVMPRGETHPFHAGIPGELRPLPGPITGRVKISVAALRIRIFPVFFG